MAGALQIQECELKWSFRLTLVRHGETDENRNKIIQGHKDTVMNKHGIEQVERVSDRLKDENFIKIYSSDLTRAYKTAEKICLKNLHMKELKISNEILLRERSYGNAEGGSRKELKRVLMSGKLPCGAETGEQVQKRVVKFFTTLVEDLFRHEKVSRRSGNQTILNHELNNHEENFSHNEDPLLWQKVEYSSDINNKCEMPHKSREDRADQSKRIQNVLVVSHGGILHYFMEYFLIISTACFQWKKEKFLNKFAPILGCQCF